MSKKTKKQRRQKRLSLFWVVPVGGLLLLGAALLLARPGGEEPALAPIQVVGQAAIRVDRELIDYGDVRFNVQKNFTFTVTNVGDERLRFQQAPYIEVVQGC